MTTCDVPDTPAFIEARRIMAPELSEELRQLSLGQAVTEFKNKVYCYPSDHPLRGFAKEYFGMNREQAKRLRQWLTNPELITLEENKLLLSVLQRKTAARSDTVKVPKQDDKNELSVIEHSISVLNSVSILVDKAGITPDKVLDGHRMYVQRAVDRICSRFGIVASFQDPSESLNTPMTRSDLKHFERQQEKGKRQ